MGKLLNEERLKRLWLLDMKGRYTTTKILKRYLMV